MGLGGVFSTVTLPGLEVEQTWDKNFENKVFSSVTKLKVEMGELGIGYRPNEENVIIVAYTFSELQLFHEKGANNYTDLFLGNGVKVTYLHSADGDSYLKMTSKLGWAKRQWEKFFSMTTRAELALENDLGLL